MMNRIVFDGKEIEVISCKGRNNHFYINILDRNYDDKATKLQGFKGTLKYHEHNTNGLDTFDYSGIFDVVKITKYLDHTCLDCCSLEVAQLESENK